jgi:hypothetical protein
MTIATISRSDTPAPATNRAKRPSHAGLLMTVLLVAPAVAILLAPFAALTAAAFEQPAILTALIEAPLTAAQLGLGLMISVLFCVLPFYLRTADYGPQITSADIPGPIPARPATVVVALTPRDGTAAHPLAA